MTTIALYGKEPFSPMLPFTNVLRHTKDFGTNCVPLVHLASSRWLLSERKVEELFLLRFIESSSRVAGNHNPGVDREVGQ